MDYVILLVGASVLFELLEVYLQQASTLKGMLDRLYSYYEKSVFFFFLVHPSFYFMLFVVVLTDRLNMGMIFILSFKIFDMFYKLDMIKRVYKTFDVPMELQSVLDMPIPTVISYMGVFLYPLALYFALI
jgi:hypothetical protein